MQTVVQKNNDNIDDWYLRYLFLPNSAYVMKISDISYHSVSKLPPGHQNVDSFNKTDENPEHF